MFWLLLGATLLLLVVGIADCWITDLFLGLRNPDGTPIRRESSAFWRRCQERLGAWWWAPRLGVILALAALCWGLAVLGRDLAVVGLAMLGAAVGLGVTGPYRNLQRWRADRTLLAHGATIQPS